MTLLEALVALVILGLAAVGFLGAFQGAARSARSAEVWIEAVAYAEAAMEETKLGAAPEATVSPEPLPGGFMRAVSVEPWPGAPALRRVTVTVGLPDGGTFTLQRLAGER